MGSVTRGEIVIKVRDLLLHAAGVGAGGALGAVRLSGHLTPWADALRVRPSGAPICGVLRAVPGQRVCLVR